MFQFVFSSNHDFRAKRKCFFTSIENESQNGTPNNFLTPNVYKLMWKREAKSNSNIVFYFHRTKIWCSGNPWSCSARRKRCALNHWGRAKTPNNVASTFFNRAHLLPKGQTWGRQIFGLLRVDVLHWRKFVRTWVAKLVSYPGRHLSWVHQWLWQNVFVWSSDEKKKCSNKKYFFNFG